MSIGLFIIYFTGDIAFDAMLNTPSINESKGVNSALSGGLNVIAKYDTLAFGIMIGMLLALVISSYFVAGHPVFMFIYFIVGVIGVITSAILSNVWYVITTNPQFASTIIAFRLTNVMMLKLPIITGVALFIGLIVMFAKPEGNSGGTFG